MTKSQDYSGLMLVQKEIENVKVETCNNIVALAVRTSNTACIIERPDLHIGKRRKQNNAPLDMSLSYSTKEQKDVKSRRRFPLTEKRGTGL